MLYADVLVPLAMQEYLFAAGLVLEGDLVEAAAIRRRPRPEDAAGAVVGQLVGRHRLGVVDTTRDDRPIRVTLEELDDHFHADTRKDLRTPLISGPTLREPQKHRAV